MEIFLPGPVEAKPSKGFSPTPLLPTAPSSIAPQPSLYGQYTSLPNLSSCFRRYSSYGSMRWGDPVTGGSVPLAVPDGRSFWGSAFRACSGIRLWRSVSFSSFTCSAGFRLPKSGGCRFGGLSRVPELGSLPDITGEKQAVVAGFRGLAEVFSARSFLSCASRGSFPGVWDRCDWLARGG